MGVYYYLVSHSNTKKLVEEEDFDQIDKYVVSPTPFEGPVDHHFDVLRGLISGADQQGGEQGAEQGAEQDAVQDNKWVEGAFQIASRAVKMGKENVLRHVADKICFDYRRDGNSYDLFVLATEKHQFAMIDVLWEIAVENCYASEAEDQLQYAARRLLGYSDLDEQQVIQQLPLYAEKVSSLEDVYHYSKFWKKPAVQKWLEDNYPSKLLENVVNDKVCSHSMQLSKFEGGPYRWGDWGCDVCSASFPKGTERWLCKLCCRDICVDCHK